MHELEWFTTLLSLLLCYIYLTPVFRNANIELKISREKNSLSCQNRVILPCRDFAVDVDASHRNQAVSLQLTKNTNCLFCEVDAPPCRLKKGRDNPCCQYASKLPVRW